ncbi:MAG TPA: M23 family metallopeptidase [Solirubrobacteraceae bacterium]|jgi:murein DD-endopeptidase MepM/ murein hydrolase activator NlpD
MRLSLVLAVALLALPAPALASAGGAAYPEPVGGAAYGAPSTSRPTIGGFSVPARVREGRLPRVRYRVDELGVAAVRVRIAILPLHGHAAPLSVELGRRRTGRTEDVRWPRHVRLAAGRYLVRLHAVDELGRTLERRAHASGRATLTVVPAPKPKRKPKRAADKPAPAAAPAPTPPASTAPPPGPSSPTPAAGSAGVFPVAGPHTYGDVFGAPRRGYTHQGQDVLAAEGTPIVAPLAGTITVAAYQAAGAGYYLLEHAADGRDFFFAHCQEGSFAVAQGATVAAGAPLCRVGHTGDATGPHLHFEIWVGGWHVGNGAPVDPLPQLRAWDA